MKCAIMQPTYLPWSGYFNLISKVDKFIFLDDVQFEKRSWQIRNRILIQGQENIISIPTRKTSQNTLIFDVKISNDSDWHRKHWLTINSAYGKSPFGKEVLTILEPFFIGEPPERLSEFNQAIICHIAQKLSLNTTFFQASDLQCGQKRSDHLIEIIKSVECDEYLSPLGSSSYLEEDNFSGKSGVRLTFQQYVPVSYTQTKSHNFTSHLSIVDVIANIGIEKTKEYIL